jgi:hypothetical protein
MQSVEGDGSGVSLTPPLEHSQMRMSRSKKTSNFFGTAATFVPQGDKSRDLLHIMGVLFAPARNQDGRK